jgi:hypothetical protein
MKVTLEQFKYRMKASDSSKIQVSKIGHFLTSFYKLLGT